MEQTYNILPLGDAALVINYRNVIEDGLHHKVLAVAKAIKEALIEGVGDIVPAYSSVTVHYDVIVLTKTNKTIPAFHALKKQLEIVIREAKEQVETVSRHFDIPVCYSPKYALDVADVAAMTQLKTDEIITLHTSKTYKVYMIGFLPGFAYMGEVDERIAVPRKHVPRLTIEEGYVGIAAKQTGIYPLTSPGGWQLIGRTPIKLFDKHKAEPVLFAAGDEVKFFSITEDEFDNY
ncbi:MAG: 5-oxoprolinase subunit PxpB [Bacteroidota bacterium]|nr:5-oxoprolinase subunit PxpB [Bacteroidota bacterium]